MSSESGFPDLRAFLDELRRQGELRVVDAEVDPRLEAAEIHRRVIASGGPSLLFTRVRGADLPLVTNLFGTARRAELALLMLFVLAGNHIRPRRERRHEIRAIWNGRHGRRPGHCRGCDEDRRPGPTHGAPGTGPGGPAESRRPTAVTSRGRRAGKGPGVRSRINGRRYFLDAS